MIAGTSKFENVVAQLEQLGGHASFRLEEGHLRSGLQEAVFEELDADTVESLSQQEYDIFVNMDATVGTEIVIDCRVECDGAEYLSEISLSGLSGRLLHELSDRLLRLLEARKPAGSGVYGEVVIRRRPDSDRYDIYQATRMLQVSAEWLKSVIPCTEYHYDQVGGRKVIREYFWSRELIEKLCKLRESRPRHDDETYIARTCCEGDTAWAREILRSLSRSNALAPRSAKAFVPPKTARIISRQFVNDQTTRKKKDS